MIFPRLLFDIAFDGLVLLGRIFSTDGSGASGKGPCWPRQPPAYIYTGQTRVLSAGQARVFFGMRGGPAAPASALRKSRMAWHGNAVGTSELPAAASFCTIEHCGALFVVYNNPQPARSAVLNCRRCSATKCGSSAWEVMGVLGLLVIRCLSCSSLSCGAGSPLLDLEPQDPL